MRKTAIVPNSATKSAPLRTRYLEWSVVNLHSIQMYNDSLNYKSQ